MQHQAVEEVKRLLQELDYYKYIINDEDKVIDIETKLDKYRKLVPQLDDDQKQFSPYPDLVDPEFQKKIFSKREFNKSRYDIIDTSKSFDDLANEKCSSTDFRLSKNQVFLKNFMSQQTPYNGILLFHGVGVGKCHAKDTPILMHDGSIKLVQDIEVGDIVMGDDSTPRHVQSVVRGSDQMFKIKPKKGDSYTVNSEHILCLKYTGRGAIEKVVKNHVTMYKALRFNNKTLAMESELFAHKDDAEAYLDTFDPLDKVTEISVTDFQNLSKKLQKNLKGYRTRVEFPFQPVPVDPFLFGKWLMNPKDVTPEENASCSYLFQDKTMIPRQYLCNDTTTRTQLMGGMVFRSGKPINNCYKISFGTNTKLLLKDFLYLCRSLGFAAYANGKIVHVSGEGLENIPESKVQKRRQKKDVLMTGIRIISQGRGEYFGFSVDGNHRYVLGDFTVTHNSCSAISIAEHFQPIFKKKTLVLMPTNLQDNFRKQIFDINKVNKDMNVSNQCTGMKYLLHVPNRKLLDVKDVNKQIRNIINDKYEFKGFMEFANQVQADKKAHSRARFINKIKEKYSDRVIIIDEVHNVRQGKSSESKIVPPRLMEVLKYAERVKLILLSATPMFNEASEIIWLINLLLANDKRPLLVEKDMFDGNKRLTRKGSQILEDACNGYISFMRGENPFSFPFRLNPSINADANIINPSQVPILDIKGKPIPDDMKLKLKNLELIKSEMSSFQQSIYTKAEKNMSSTAQDDEFDEDNPEDVQKNTYTEIIQISNVVFPGGADYKQCYGKRGVENCFDKISESPFKLQYKSETIEFLSEQHINTYAPKLKRIVDYIKNAKGIVFVYSFFKEAGVLPLAMALEHAGFKKVNNNNILYNVKSKTNNFKINGKTPCYSILTQNRSLTPDFNGEIEQIRSDANKNGDVVKVILGTSVAAEGIDFKYIREVHLLEPWYHLNKVSQIIGRAIRNCSHISLPPHDRNVTLYHHVNVISARQEETIDMKIYRIAENKQIAIDEVEAILKRNAIDCPLNKHALYFDPDVLQKSIKVITSQGTVIPNYRVGDESTKYSGYRCKWEPTNIKIDDATFNASFYVDDIDRYASHIAVLFQTHHKFTFEDILKNLSAQQAEKEIIMYTLEYMLNTKRIIFNRNNVEGYIIYRNKYYLFQPVTSDERLIDKQRADYKPYIQKQLRIDEHVQKAKSKMIVNVDSKAVSMSDSIKTIYQDIINDKLKLEHPIVTKLEQYIIDFMIDRLDQSELRSLCRELMNTLESDHKDRFVKLVVKSLINAFVMVQDPNTQRLKYMRDVFETEENIYVFTDNEFKKASPYELDQLRNANKLTVMPSVTDIRDLKGYVEYANQQGKYVTRFKTIDKGKSNSSGTVCNKTSTIKKDHLAEWINTYENINIEGKTISVLCNIFELFLRSSKSKVFGRPYEVQMIKLMKKKID